MSDDTTAMVRQGFVTNDRGALQVANLPQAMEFAKLLANTDFVPPLYQGKPGNVLAALQMGAEVGLAPMQALQNIAVINGRPAVWGDAQLALVRAHPDFDGIEELTRDGTATCKVWRIERSKVDGSPRRECIERSFSMDDAKRAGLTGKAGPWKDYPGRMLQMRARGFALRDAFPDVLKGILVPREEAMDTPHELRVDEAPVSAALPSHGETISSAVAARGGPAKVRELLGTEDEDEDEPASAEAQVVSALVEAAGKCTVIDDLNGLDYEFGQISQTLGVESRKLVARALDAAQARIKGEDEA